MYSAAPIWLNGSARAACTRAVKIRRRAGCANRLAPGLAHSDLSAGEAEFLPRPPFTLAMSLDKNAPVVMQLHIDV
eukprot:4952389-Pleurochrysis_carterae.AAC.2